MSPAKPHSSFRLSKEARVLLARLAKHYGLNRTSVLEWIIREQARAVERTHPRRS